MPLPEFKDEREFREKWIHPFLTRMGYILPTLTHGPNEQGKDFIFAEYDRFGHLRFMAAQAKLGNIGTAKSEIRDLLEQVRKCFDVTIKYHKGAHEGRISAVYIMATGTISAQAREQITDTMRKENYGENVYYLDGSALDNQERHATYAEDMAKRKAIGALLDEVALNLTTVKYHSASEPLRFRTFALERAVQLEAMSYGIHDLWDTLAKANDLIAGYGHMRAMGLIHNTARLERMLPFIEADLRKVRSEAQEAMFELNRKYEIEIDPFTNSPK